MSELNPTELSHRIVELLAHGGELSARQGFALARALGHEARTLVLREFLATEGKAAYALMIASDDDSRAHQSAIELLTWALSEAGVQLEEPTSSNALLRAAELAQRRDGKPLALVLKRAARLFDSAPSEFGMWSTALARALRGLTWSSTDAALQRELARRCAMLMDS